MTEIEVNDYDALGKIIESLKVLSPEDRKRILQTVATFYQIGSVGSEAKPANKSLPTQGAVESFSEDTVMSPKEFLLEKQPRTDVERIACLAFYLTHYRSTPHFKTLDLSKLNTEAAHPKFSNAAVATNNALKLGYLAPGTKGQKQLSAAAEQFVRSLPDREAAKASMSMVRPRNKSHKKPEKPIKS